MTENIVTEKPCSTCKQVKPLSEFSRTKNTKIGRMSGCKKCRYEAHLRWLATPQGKRKKSEQVKAWRQTPKGIVHIFKRTQADYAQKLKRQNPDAVIVPPDPITIEQYQDMHEQQAGKCAICRQPPKNRRLVIDHCHATGKIRALLCDNCNKGLGHFRDSPTLLDAAKHYLLANST